MCFGFGRQIGVYSRHMETIKQEGEPKLSIVEEQKEIASKFVAERINTLQKEKGLSLLSAVREVYEEVKGQSYREEQAAALLLLVLEKRNEADTVQQEAFLRYPIFAGIVGDSEISAANDEKYLIAA